MKDSQPSATALRAARHRAEHQRLEGGKVFADPYAGAIFAAAAPEAEAEAADPLDRRMRLFIAARSRFADEALAVAIGRGVRQAVILGAGLDTLAFRAPHTDVGLRIFEVDHPATQAWKRACLATAGLAPPAGHRFVAVDFERQALEERLAAAGYAADRPAFFIWLGVVPYLTRAAIRDTLAFIAATPGSEVVFDYSEPNEGLSDERRAARARRAAGVAALGEPWISFFAPTELAAMLHALGFDEREDLAASDIATRFLGAPKGTTQGAGGHFMRARRAG